MKTDLKHPRKYKIRLLDGWHEVKGYRVIIPDFEEFSFFVHRALLLNTISKTYVIGDWHISEKETGNCFSSCVDDCDSRQEAIDETVKFLTRIGKEKFLEAYKRPAIAPK